MAREINLRTLKRIDNEIEEIIGSASSVALYQFDQEKQIWTKCDVEGSLHVYKKHTSSSSSPIPSSGDSNEGEESMHPIIRMLLGGRRTSDPSLNHKKHSEQQQKPSSLTSQSHNSSHNSRHGFVILNRVNTSNLQEDITHHFEIQTTNPFLLYKTASGDIFCIWFYKPPECSKVSRLIEGIKATS